MSGASKRLQEEGSHPTTSKRPLEETGLFCSYSGKLIQSVANDFHLQSEPGQDGRLAKVQRIEPRFIDKRSPLLHRMSSSSNNSCLDHTITSENRPELRVSKDSRDGRTEKREAKVETRELYTQPRVDPLGSKAYTATRPDSRLDEKERSDRQSHSNIKADVKLEKYSYSAPDFLNWKEPKELHRSKRYSESPSDGMVTCVSRHGLHSTEEVGNVMSTAEELDFLEAHEAVGESKVDLKGEDNFRDKDKKKKDEKHRDCGEREKERNDRRNNLLQGGPSNELKELVREDKDTDKWERERKDAQKDKEQNREKEPNKGELSNAREKESLHSDKELVDASVNIPEHESITFEPKALRDDTWKALSRELKDKKLEREIDVEGVTHESRNQCYDNELDDGCTEGDVVTERDTGTYGYGVHQRRRMLRSRGTPQTPHREPPVRSRARLSEGCQGICGISTVVYKAGLCMQELLNSWKKFEASQDSKNEESLQNGPTLEIRIPAEYATATNRQVRGGQLWGTDIYTNDSDIVAVLMHTGYCRPTSSLPSSISELRATIRVLPPRDCYTSTLRNNVRSRAWGAGIDCSFRVESSCIMKKGGRTIDLEPRLTQLSAMEPTLAALSVERTITTRSASSNAFRQQRCVREVTIQYNLCNEPWIKYSISIVADKGLKKPLFTSARLKKGEVLYLETHFNRYELCFNGEKAISNGTISAPSQAPETDQEKLQNHNLHVQTCDRILANHENIIDVFRWSRCKKPLPQTVMRSIGIPLPTEHLEVLEENLDWEDIQWSKTGVWVAGKEFNLARVHFLSPN